MVITRKRLITPLVLTVAVLSLFARLGPAAIVLLAVAGGAYILMRRGVISTDSLLLLVLSATGYVLAISGFDIAVVILVPVLVFVLLRYVSVPLSTVIARTNTSIRWKFEVVLAGLSVLFLLVSLITFGAMDFIHQHLHDIQDIALASPAEALRAVNELEDTQHGILFSNVPVFGLFGILAAAFGSALAWSVIKPVRSMGDALRRIGSGDYSQPIQVENRDELGGAGRTD